MNDINHNNAELENAELENNFTANRSAIDIFREEVRRITANKRSREEIAELLNAMKNEKNFEAREYARNAVIESFIPLVMAMANRYHSPYYDDLVAEGNLALVRCIDGYDIEKGEFANYICSYLMTAMHRFLTSNRSVRISYSGEYLRRKMVKFLVAFKGEFGRMPSDEETMDCLNLSERQLKNAKARMGITAESLNAVIDNGEDSTEFGNFIPDENAPSITEVLAEKEKNELLLKTLKVLSNAQQDILKSLYGIGKKESETMEDIGKRYGKSKMWVCQNKQKAFGKLLAMQILQNER